MPNVRCRAKKFSALQSWRAWLCAAIVLFGTGFPAADAQQHKRGRCEAVSYASIHGVGGPGPYNYTNRSARSVEKQKVVTGAHFTGKILRGAIAGAPNASIYANLQYTLKAIPNHHEALFAMGLYQYKVRKNHPDFFRTRLAFDEKYRDVSCWFDRAQRHAPRDIGVHNAYGRFLHMAGKRKEAIEAFQKVTQLAPESPQGHYNLGLAYYSVGNYAQAAKSARRAQELGHTRQELQARLKRKGHWSAK